MTRTALLLLFVLSADAACGQQLLNKRLFRGGGEESGAAVFSFDSKHLYAFFPWFGVQIVDPSTGKASGEITLPEGSYPWAMALSPNGKTLAVSHVDSGEFTLGEKRSKGLRIGIYDLSSRKRLSTLQDEIGTVRAITFMPDNKTVITIGNDRTLRWWDTRAGRVIASEKTGGAFFDYDQPSGFLAVSAGKSGVEVWEAKNRRLIKRLASPSNFKAIALSPGGQTVAVGTRKDSNDTSIRLYDVRSGQLTATFDDGVSDYTTCLAYSSDGRLLAEAELNGGVVLWDAQTGKQLSRQAGGVVEELFFSPNGKILAQVHGISDSSNGVMLWDVVEE